MKFESFVNLASERLGAKAILANDDFFAPKEALLKSTAPLFLSDKYTSRGKWMDGWETRRRRTPGHDWCIIKLGCAGKIFGANINTAFFLGNHPSFASIDACFHRGQGRPTERAWKNILGKSPLKKGSDNLFSIGSGEIFTHIRLNIFPDGGVARLKIFGEVHCDWRRLKKKKISDLAAIQNGGKVLLCNDMFFGPKENLIMPGRSTYMGDGWETKRKRGPGNDWVIVKLGHPGRIQRLQIETHHFKGNFPDRASVDAYNLFGAAAKKLRTSKIIWTPLLKQSKLKAHSVHYFNHLLSNKIFTHLRLNIFPDGGISRFRVWGKPV